MNEPISLTLPSPLQQHVLKGASDRSFPVWFKRDDLIDPVISGNKWRKLEPNLRDLYKAGYHSLVTIGGAFSNHLAATARACQLSGVKSTGLVRSGTLDMNNPTMQFCASCGMKLKRVDRSWSESDSLSYAEESGAFWLPEGGSNEAGVSGIDELVKEILSQLTPDVVFVSVGSGGTLAGLARSLPERTRIIAVSSFETERMIVMMEENYNLERGRVEWSDRFSRSGFGKYDEQLVSFADNFYRDLGIPLDPLYTAKTAFAMMEILLRGELSDNEKVVFLHTGGLQGWLGYRYRFPQHMLPVFVNDLAHGGLSGKM